MDRRIVDGATQYPLGEVQKPSSESSGMSQNLEPRNLKTQLPVIQPRRQQTSKLQELLWSGMRFVIRNGQSLFNLQQPQRIDC